MSDGSSTAELEGSGDQAEVAWAVAVAGRVRGLHCDRPLPAASTIKVAIATCFWRAVGEGRFDPAATADQLELTGDGALLDHLPGLVPTFAHCATLMLAVSDNAATNAILALVGLDGVQRECERLGMGATRIRRRMADWEAQAAGRENETTPRDLAVMMASLADPRVVPVPVRLRVVTDLAASHHLDVIAEVLVGRADAIYPKAGELAVARHDCALVRADRRVLGVAVCSSPPASAAALRAAVVEAAAAAEVGAGRS